MKIENDLKLDFKDVLIRPKRSTLKSRAQIIVSRTFKLKHAKRELNCVPIIAANMDTVGTFEMARKFQEHDMMVALHKFYSNLEIANFYKSIARPELVFYTIGANEKDLEKLRTFLTFNLTHKLSICLDAANGYTEEFVSYLKKVRAMVPDAMIMAGNVVTYEMTEELILSGADIVKCGIGPGSVCTTRKIAGVGYPQISAVMETSDAAHGSKGWVCSDGGCVVPGDIAKAFCAGADFVMLGGMLAGHDEAAGDLVLEDGKITGKKFYGMSSDTAMDKYMGGVAKYKASEGKTVTVPYKGPVEDTIQSILGGIRSACTYIGAESIKEMNKRTTFVRTNIQTNDVFN